MAGTVTTTEQTYSSIRRVKFEWTSTAGGVASATTTYPVDGELLSVSFVPGSGGSTPTTGYDVNITDGDGVDILNGLGANLSETTTVNKLKSDGLLPCASTVINLIVANAGNTKSGAVIVKYR